VKAGEKKIWNGSIKYNQFMDNEKALRIGELSDMKVVWKPSGILFVDGNKVGEE
jgi:hypothetical protein